MYWYEGVWRGVENKGREGGTTGAIDYICVDERMRSVKGTRVYRSTGCGLSDHYEVERLQEEEVKL